MIGVSIRKLEVTSYAKYEYFYQCPFCGKDQYYQRVSAYMCSMCYKTIDPVERLFTEGSVLNRLTFHLAGVHPHYKKYFPFDENKIKIKWKEDD